MSRICLTLSGPDAGANISVSQKYRGQYQALELRIDLLDNPLEDAREFLCYLGGDAELLELLQNDPSVIITLRRVEDGGRFSGTVDEQRRIITDLLEAVAENAPDVWIRLVPVLAVDLEAQNDHSELAAKIRGMNMTCIRSLHYFSETPENMCGLLEECAARGDIPKLAVMPAGLHDLSRIFQEGREFARRYPGKRFILLGMGGFGVPSRIVPERIGSYLSFCSAGKGVAPGQMDCREISGNYRYGNITEDTPLFAIIGNPVSHSRSPETHNRKFRRDGRDALYIPLLCDDTSRLPEFAVHANLLGASVTVPHKESVREILQIEDSAVSAVGACNTILYESGKWRGMNTDVDGFIQPVLPLLREIRDSRGEVQAAVIGAGGAAKAAVYALLREGCQVLILNRSPGRAADLAQHFSIDFPGQLRSGSLGPESEDLLRAYRRIIVQTTSVGMAQGHGGDPLSFYEFSGDEVLYDIIYTPPVTDLMRRADLAGCKTMNGWEMFRLQADLQADAFSHVIDGYEKSPG